LAQGKGDPAEHAKAAMMEASLALAGLDSVDAEGCPSESMNVAPSVDLTGDGLDEVLQYDFVQDFCDYPNWSTKVTVLKGATGDKLWSRKFGGFVTLIPAGKIDSSGGDDLIVLEAVFRQDRGALVWSATYSAVSGTDGSTIWTYGHEGAFVAANDASLSVSLALPLSLSDATGDGVQDLLVGQYNVAFTEVPPLNGSATQIVGRFEVLSGATGLVAAAFPGHGQNEFPDAVYLPDGNGDGQSDIAVISSALGEDYVRLRIVAFPGKGGPPLWTHEMLSPGIQLPEIVGAELSGDGRGDLLITSQDMWYLDKTHVNAVIAGPGMGASRWSFVTDGQGSARPVPDISGDRGDEVLVVSNQYDYYAYAYLLRGSGASPSPGPLELWYREANVIEPVGDADGDGATDVLALTYHYDQDTGDYFDTTEVVSGREGETVWSKTHSVGGFPYSHFVPMNDDANGNGTADLWFVTEAATDQYMLTEGGTGSPVWGSARKTDAWLIRLESARLSGPGPDVFETVWSEDARRYYYRAISGEAGALMWTWA
jgi:hypothetical protein